MTMIENDRGDRLGRLAKPAPNEESRVDRDLNGIVTEISRALLDSYEPAECRMILQGVSEYLCQVYEQEVKERESILEISKKRLSSFKNSN